MGRLKSAARLISAGVLAMCALGGTAGAVSITAHITADNHYGLYTGGAKGSGLTFVARNEKGASGNPGTYNWSQAETWKFNAVHGDYLYLLVWDDGAQQSWIGDFAWPGHSLFSNKADWLYAVGGPNPGVSGNLPALGTVQGVIAGATWLTPQAAADDGSRAWPWGNIAAVDDRADFVWGDTLDVSSKYDSKYLIFRTTKPVVAPEPATMTLLGTGLLGIAGLVRRRKR